MRAIIYTGAQNMNCLSERNEAIQDLMGKPEEKRPLGDTGVGRRIILRWIAR